MAKGKQHSNRGKQSSGVNPQGYDEETLTPNPTSQLEDRAKKSNTKR